MTTMASQITSLTIVFSTVYSRRRSKKISKLRVTGLCAGNSPGPVNSRHKGPLTRKLVPFDDVIIRCRFVMLFPPVIWMNSGVHCSCEFIIRGFCLEKIRPPKSTCILFIISACFRAFYPVTPREMNRMVDVAFSNAFSWTFVWYFDLNVPYLGSENSENKLALGNGFDA